MSVIVHLKDGRNQQLPVAASCSWQPATTDKTVDEFAPRWLICQNAKGEVVARFKEPEILGYRIDPVIKKSRFRFPKLRNRMTT